MGLFGKLFEKKVCSICGGEIGLLGNRKLADGNCCKKCAGGLSPWFEDRRESTVEQIQQQLAYRAQNAQELKSLKVSTVIGEYEKMYIEEVNGVPNRFFITSSSDYLDENPDIISFDNVVSCSIDIDENEEEIMRENKDGEEVSYNPPRFTYHYNFYIDMVICNTPWFDSIRFNINDEDVTLEHPAGSAGASGIRRGPMGAPLMRSSVTNRESDRYQEFEQMCNRICQAVEDARRGTTQQPAEPVAETDAPAICPACGAPANGNRFCEFCGTKLM